MQGLDMCMGYNIYKVLDLAGHFVLATQGLLGH